MARPVATALIDGGHSKEYNFGDLGGGILLTLTGSATNAPILEWEWSILPPIQTMRVVFQRPALC